MATRERVERPVSLSTADQPGCHHPVAPPLVSIITINYNQAEITRQFLNSSRLLTYPNYELVVVDNASQPPLETVVDKASYANLRIIRSEKNLGFTGGNNAGMEVANGTFFFIVNNDTELTPTLLTELMRPFTEQSDVGVTCPKINFFDAPDIVQFAGYNPMNMYTGVVVPVGYQQLDNERYHHPGPTYFAHGCAMLVSRRVVERVGRFADSFFLYYEELDWSQRIRDAGYVIYYQPSATILHKESVSVGRQNPLKTYYLTRNRILFMRRHCSPVQRLVFYCYFTTCVLPKHLLTYVLTGKLNHAWAFLTGVFWNFTSVSTSPV